MKKPISATIVFGFALVVASLLCCISQAAIVDQSQTSSDGSVAFWHLEGAVAQTFTPSISGYLDTLSLKIGVSGSSAAQGLIETIHVAIMQWATSTPPSAEGRLTVF